MWGFGEGGGADRLRKHGDFIGRSGGWTETREERGVWLGRKMGSKSRAGSWVWRYRKPAREVRVNRVGQFEMEQVFFHFVFLQDAMVSPLGTWECGL